MAGEMWDKMKICLLYGYIVYCLKIIQFSTRYCLLSHTIRNRARTACFSDTIYHSAGWSSCLQYWRWPPHCPTLSASSALHLSSISPLFSCISIFRCYHSLCNHSHHSSLHYLICMTIAPISGLVSRLPQYVCPHARCCWCVHKGQRVLSLPTLLPTALDNTQTHHMMCCRWCCWLR